ncbi:L,D-transpeptidase [Metabacillus sp. SLBN-84]
MKKWLFALITAFFLFSQASFPAKADGIPQLIIINKSTNKLAFFDNGKLMRVFHVATGRDNSFTPEGTFPIVNKIKNRPYYKENIPGGDSRNPLGDRWLGLRALGTEGTTYAIHGNNNANSIGTYASAGCIRMHNEEIRYLFDQVQTGTSVIILHSTHSFEAIAAANNYPHSLPADSPPAVDEKPPAEKPVPKPKPAPKPKPEPKPEPAPEDPLSCIKSKLQGRIYFPDIHVKMDVSCTTQAGGF